ncbi:MAG TPA: Ig-like domain-containing protein [Actinomycetota bacterium]
MTGAALATVLVMGLVASVLTGGATAAAPDFPALLKNDPYLRLFTQVNDCAQVRAANQLSGAALSDRLDELTRWYDHFHSEGSNNFVLGNDCKGSSSSTLAKKLADRGAWTSNYRNGSFVSQANAGQMNFGEAADLETKAPLSIGTYWPGNYRPNIAGDNNAAGARLTQALNANATTVRVSAVASADRPSGSPATWPFLDSRGTGQSANAHSTNSHDFVSWIRIDDELMQVAGEPQASGGEVVLQVRRGLWGTGTASHNANVRVMAPTYIGNVNGESALNGTPTRNSTSAALRYGLKLWQPGGYNWLADRIQSTFGSDLQGFNTVWLDVSSCFQYNHADPYGNPVFGWYDAGTTKMMTPQYGVTQKVKLQGLRARFPGVRFAGNNMDMNDACSTDLLSNGYDGGVLENYVKTSTTNWSSQMDITFKSFTNDWPAIFWPRWDYLFTGSAAAADAYERFAYASVLLAYRDSATRYQYGATFNLDKPDQLYMWDWGTPQGEPTRLSDVTVAGTQLYRRDFQNGIVVVNSGSSAATYNLGGTFYDVVNQTGNEPKSVTQVTIGAHDAAFLLTSIEGGGGGGGADTSAPNTAVSNPTSGSSVPVGTVSLAGSATDDRGLSGVQIAIRDTATNQWLRRDGTWGTYQVLDATLGSRILVSGSDTYAPWTYSWTTTRTGTFEVQAVALDPAGNVDASPASSSFSVVGGVTPPPTPTPTPVSTPTPTPVPTPVPTATPTPVPPPSGPDAIAPDTSLSAPAAGARVAQGTLQLSGSASDNQSVYQVRIGIRNKATRLWWHANGTWSSTFEEQVANLSVPGGTTTSWTFAWTPPTAGQYIFAIRARDVAGNYDRSPAGNLVTVGSDSTAARAQVALMQPAGSAAAQDKGRMILKGSVSDDSAVGRVTIGVRDRATGKWWHGKGEWGHVRAMRVDLGAPGSRSSNWRTFVRLDPGRYFLRLRSVDASGNVSKDTLKVRVTRHAIRVGGHRVRR